MLESIDNFLNRITMYRLVLYCLLVLIGAAFVLAFFGKVPFSPLALVYSFIIVCAVCWAANELFAKVFNAPANSESFWITAFILVLIITPLKTLGDSHYIIFLGWASVLAMASKYIVAIGKKHMFNPAAMAVAITSFALGQAASWWVGTLWMLPFVLITGILITRKIQRWDLFFSFLVFGLAAIFVTSTARSNVGDLLYRISVDTPLFFFGFVMLTEPLTTPPDKWRRILYGALVGILFNPNFHIGNIYSTPELALLVGNVFVYFISPKHKYLLALKARYKIGTDTADFVFEPDKPAKFKPGQYLEWTLGHSSPDLRGNRRYFTVASSPTESQLHLGVKFYENGSTFKRALLQMKRDDVIVASQLAGDFVMPNDKNKKLAFIAGGIGITPFRSMIKYLTDTGEKRDVALFYSNKTADEISYKNIFDEAQNRIGLKTIYTLTDKNQLPQNWNGYTGKLNPDIIARELPDFKERMFFISGPRAMVTSFEKTLKNLGIPQSHIKIDFFPGFA